MEATPSRARVDGGLRDSSTDGANTAINAKLLPNRFEENAAGLSTRLAGAIVVVECHASN